MSCMVPSLCWIPNKAAKRVPVFEEIDDATYEQEKQMLMEQAKAAVVDVEEEEFDSVLEKEKQNLANQVREKIQKKKKKRQGKQDNNNNNEEMADDNDEDIVKEYGLDDYSDDDVDDNDNEEGVVNAVLQTKDDGYQVNDPYFTEPFKDELDERFDEESLGDLTIQDSDLLVLVGKVESEESDELSRLEVCVFEKEEDNVYVHHDILLQSFPLATEWCDYLGDGSNNNNNNTSSSSISMSNANQRRNLVAVGTFLPVIEIWDLDVIDPTKPVARLGDYKAATMLSSGNSKKKNRAMQMNANPHTHTDAVICLSWNSEFRNFLASGSADKSVKIWDLNTLQCKVTLNHHKDKVQGVRWHPKESHLLLTGSFDRRCAIVDPRGYAANPNDAKNCVFYPVGSDVEALTWNCFQPEQFLVSCENGEVYCYDARNNAKPVFALSAHNKPATSLSLNPSIPGMLLTTSTDKSYKVWDIHNSKPAHVFTKPTHMQLFSSAFCRESGQYVAIGGNSEFRIVDILHEPTVVEAFRDRLPQQEGAKDSSNNNTNNNNNKKGKK